MRGKFFLLWMALVAGMLLVPMAAQGQRPTWRESPTQFGAPSAFGLLQRSQGVLPNYYQNYLPQQQLQQNLRAQQYEMQRQGTAIQDLQNQWLAPQRDGTSLAPTGRVGGFMNTLHYFPGKR